MANIPLAPISCSVFGRQFDEKSDAYESGPDGSVALLESLGKRHRQDINKFVGKVRKFEGKVRVRCVVVSNFSFDLLPDA